LLAGETVFGLFVAELRTPGMGLMLDAAGYDFAIFDMEHGSYTLTELATMVPGFQGCRCTPLVRVPAVRREFFQATLDLGAGGIVVPMLESAADARTCVELMKYPPLGRRGVSYCRPHSRFQTPVGGSFTDEANQNTLLVVQIESARGLEHLDEIVAVPGIDVVFVGNADLAQSLGCPPDLDHGPLREALERILRTAAAKRIIGGANITDPQLVAELHACGLQFVSLTTDVERFVAGLTTVRDAQRA
jgi:2-keto-3-deoxy-L-rhamnonate aldolase RhmA